MGRFEEAIGIIGPLLRGERVTLAGSYYQVGDAVSRPPPDRSIPILVAVKGRRMLRLTARYADAGTPPGSGCQTTCSAGGWPS